MPRRTPAPRPRGKRPSKSSPRAAPDQATPRQDAPARPTRRASEPDEGFVAVGRVLAPFGLKGELKVQPLTDNPERFAPKSKLYAGQQPVTVARSREAGGFVYLTLKGYPDRTSIERFRHAVLQIPEADLPALPEGEFYRFQLLGLNVFDGEGSAIGTLDEIIETGANDVYRIRTPEGKDVLLPALDDVVLSVDLGANRMVVSPLDWR